MLRRSSPSPIKSGRHYLTHLDEPTAGTLRLLSTPSSIWSVLLLTYILLQGKENLLLNFLKVCSIFYGLIVFWGFSSCLLRELGLWAVAVVGPESPLRPWIGYWVIQTNLTWHDLTDWNHKKYDFSLCRYPIHTCTSNTHKVASVPQRFILILYQSTKKEETKSLLVNATRRFQVLMSSDCNECYKVTVANWLAWHLRFTNDNGGRNTVQNCWNDSSILRQSQTKADLTSPANDRERVSWNDDCNRKITQTVKRQWLFNASY